MVHCMKRLRGKVKNSSREEAEGPLVLIASVYLQRKYHHSTNEVVGCQEWCPRAHRSLLPRPGGREAILRLVDAATAVAAAVAAAAATARGLSHCCQRPRVGRCVGGNGRVAQSILSKGIQCDLYYSLSRVCGRTIICGPRLENPRHRRRH